MGNRVELSVCPYSHNAALAINVLTVTAVYDLRTLQCYAFQQRLAFEEALKN